MEDFSTAVLFVAGLNFGVQEQATMLDATFFACAFYNSLLVGNYTNRFLPGFKVFLSGAIVTGALSVLVEMIEPDGSSTTTPYHQEMPQGGACRANVCHI